MMPPDTFLSPAEVAELTDVRTGKSGRTREQLQIATLKTMRVPFHVSAIGRPKVARAIIEGVGYAPTVKEQRWEPSLA